jgi:hypothetical protein
MTSTYGGSWWSYNKILMVVFGLQTGKVKVKSTDINDQHTDNKDESSIHG